MSQDNRMSWDFGDIEILEIPGKTKEEVAALNKEMREKRLAGSKKSDAFKSLKRLVKPSPKKTA
jgi:hypothetical protein